MATYKQLTEAYIKVEKARRRLSKAIWDAERLGLFEKPEPFAYENYIFKPTNELEISITRLSKKPLGRALQIELDHRARK